MKWLIHILVLLAISCETAPSKKQVTEAAVAKAKDKVVKAAAAQVHATGVALKAAPQTNLAVKVATDFNEKAKVLLPSVSYEDILRYDKIVAGLLSTNLQQQVEAKKQMADKDADIAELQSARDSEQRNLDELTAKLSAMGELYEKEKNKSWWTRIYATLGFGGLIALCVCFPIIIPIAGHLLGSFINAVPSIASAIGLVSRKSFDSVVIAVQKAKEKMQAGGKTDAAAMLTDELTKSTDSSHRNLISSRKESLKI